MKRIQFPALLLFILSIASCIANADWSTVDIGPVSSPGNARVAGDSWILSGIGSGIGDTGDSVIFYSMRKKGDFSIVVELESIISSGQGAAGLMVRGNSDPRSPMLFHSYSSLSKAVAKRQFRMHFEGVVRETGKKYPSSLPCQLKLTRSGNTIAAYISENGKQWHPTFGAELPDLPHSADLGIAVFSQTPGAKCTAVFNNVTVTAPSSEYVTSGVGNTICGPENYHIPGAVTAGFVEPITGNVFLNCQSSGPDIAVLSADGKLVVVDRETDGGKAICADAAHVWYATGTRLMQTDHRLEYTKTILKNVLIEGAALFGDRLYVSNSTENRIDVLSKESGERITSYPIPRARDLATDSEGNLWVRQDSRVRIYPDKRSQGGEWVLLEAAEEQDSYKVVLPKIPTGDYKIMLHVRRSPASAIIATRLDDVELSSELDLYSPRTDFTSGVIGTATLGVGDQSLEIIVRGKNTSSSGLHVGLDRISLIPTGNKRINYHDFENLSISGKESFQQILCLDVNGKEIKERRIVFEDDEIPAGISVHPENGNLLVCDRGIQQQVHVFEKSGTYKDSFGIKNGIYAYYNTSVAGETNSQKLNHPIFAGVDLKGRFTVACNGPYTAWHNYHSPGMGTGLELRQYNSVLPTIDAELNWEHYGLEFVDTATIHPSDELTAWTKEAKYSLDYTNSAGSHRYRALTLNPFLYPYDPRLGHMNLPMYSLNTRVTELDGNTFMFLAGGRAYWAYKFRKDSNIAIPCASFQLTTPSNGKSMGGPLTIWRDTNTDDNLSVAGREDDSDSFDRTLPSNPHLRYWFLEPKGGDLWFGAKGGRSTIALFRCKGLDEYGNPVYTGKDSRHWDSKEFPFDYDRNGPFVIDSSARTGKTLYRIGGRDSEGPANNMIVRFDNWLTSKDKRWITFLPARKGSELKALDHAGRFLFVLREDANVFVVDDVTGYHVANLTPGAEVATSSGNINFEHAISAYKRNFGEYIVFVEGPSTHKILMYKWIPSSIPTSPEQHKYTSFLRNNSLGQEVKIPFKEGLNEWKPIIFRKQGKQDSNHLYKEWNGKMKWDTGADEHGHVMLSEISTNQNEFSIQVDATALDNHGEFHIYFLWQNKSNWYRLNVKDNDYKKSRNDIFISFERMLRGKKTTISKVGGINVHDKQRMQTWKITVNRLKREMVFESEGEVILDTHEKAQFLVGKIGLGGYKRRPVWGNLIIKQGASLSAE